MIQGRYKHILITHNQLYTPPFGMFDVFLTSGKHSNILRPLFSHAIIARLITLWKFSHLLYSSANANSLADQYIRQAISREKHKCRSPA